MLAKLVRTASSLVGLPARLYRGSDRKQSSLDTGRGADVVLDKYVDALPSAQNAVDTVPGWNHALPPHVGATAGSTPLYEDVRIPWCLEQFGSVCGRKLLELGPLEGIHTYLLDQQRPAFIHAIEANRLAFLRCLITKELLEIKHAKFMLGNFLLWLEQTDIRYDLIIASGVLYHMSNPVHLLELIGQRSDAVYLWTHYFSEEAMPAGDQRREALSGDVETVAFRGLNVPLYRRGYHNAWKAKTFCGGMHDRHYWMERGDVMRVLGLLGFDDIRIAHDHPQHPNGPAFSVFARRSAPGA